MKTLTRISCFLTCLALALAPLSAAEDKPGPVPGEAGAPDYSNYTQSYRLPFGNTKPVDFEHLQTLLVRVSVNGGPPM